MQKQSENKHPLKLILDDALIIVIMGVLAGCGLIYEYLLSHYAARVLGAVETTIFAMIGIMIVSMGLGSFAAKILKNPFTNFAWLELLIAFLGISSVLIIASTFAFANRFPQIIADTYGLPPDLNPEGGFFLLLQQIASISPYFMGFLLGFLIGMEIPLIARIREKIYERHISNNVGTVYGADYIGAGIGAAIWVLFMLSLEITTAAVLTASANLLAGLVFYVRYHQKIKFSPAFLLSQLILVALALNIYNNGSKWDANLEATLYKDKVIYSEHTPFQHLTVTERVMNPNAPPIYSLFINGRTQFSSFDEEIYHEMLVHPAMAASAKHDNILIIGGGDGLALREVLKWQPKHITMLELDPAIIRLFSEEIFDESTGTIINKPLLELNQHALKDKRLSILYGDAFLSVDKLLQQHTMFDSIIIDLPDPNHPDLNKLYAKRFYEKIKYLLDGGGTMVVQSTSPYHAKNAFLSIGKTVKAAGFMHVEQFHQNVPSFGEWGWTIATNNGESALTRLHSIKQIPVDTRWLTLELVRSAFEFPRHYFSTLPEIKINTLGNHALYQYHQKAWQQEQGIYQKSNKP